MTHSFLQKSLTVLALSAFFSINSAYAQSAQEKAEPDNMLAYAVAWKQTAAEYKALYYQGFNIARLRLDMALAEHKPGDKPLAIITDIDDTIFDASNYWGYLVSQNKDFFDDDIWDIWVTKNKFTATAGALDFFKYADSKGVQIFYVSNRDQGKNTYQYAINNLKSLNFPQVDK